MRAGVLNQVGGVPTVAHFNDPEPADGEVVAEVLVGALNPIDRILAAGGPMGMPAIPSVVGREGIARLGDGSRVYFKDVRPPYGSIAELVPLSPAKAIPVPDGVDDATAVALGIAGITAIGALRSRAQLKPGEVVLVLGASGALGQVGAQVARLLGAGRVVAAARHSPALERLLGSGAVDETVLLEGEYAKALKEAAPGGYDVVLDPLFGPVAEAALPAVKFGGRYVMCGASAGRSAGVGYGELTGRALLGFVGAQVPPGEQREDYQRLLAWAAAGEVVVETERIPLDRVAEAWERQGSAPHRKLVIEP